jgi:hypothetical protein
MQTLVYESLGRARRQSKCLKTSIHSRMVASMRRMLMLPILPSSPNHLFDLPLRTASMLVNTMNVILDARIMYVVMSHALSSHSTQRLLQLVGIVDNDSDVKVQVGSDAEQISRF